MKNILCVSHCILNTAAKVRQDETELAEEYALRRKLLTLVSDKEVDLLQLPCPEFLLYGPRRWGHVKDQFLHFHFLDECRKMLAPVVGQLREYDRCPGDFRILGIVSIEGSPSCGYHLTCRSAGWIGEPAAAGEIPEPVPAEEPGVMMELLAEMIKKESLVIPIMSMPEAIKLLSNM